MDLDRLKQTIGDTVLLSFSCGKDSLCAWVVLRDAGFTVVPYYMQLVPDLQFVERSLEYYERFFGVHVYRVIHPTLYRWLRQYVSTPPTRAQAIRDLALPVFTYEHVEAGVKRTAGLPNDTFAAVGTRSADSPMRRNRMAKGDVNVKTKKIYPVADYVKNDVIATLAGAGVKLPVDYRLFGRSFDGIDYRFLKQIKAHFPGDYATILEWFPEHGSEFARVEFARQHGQDISKERPCLTKHS